MIRPLGDYILILPDSLEEQLPSGIILPEKQTDEPVTGTIISWYPGSKYWEGLKKGIKVWFKMWAGEDVKYGKKTYKLVHLKDIIAFEDKERR